MASNETDWARDAEERLLDAAIARAPFEGWTSRLLRLCAPEAGLSVPEAELLCPGGARDLAVLYARRCDAEALANLPDPPPAKIRDRIRLGVLAWIDAAMAHGEATRRWTGYLALPTHAPLGLRLAWESADALWRWAGDVAADENHYTKRALLAQILISTLAVRLGSDAEAAERWLDRRIEGVMRFEKLKARLRAPGVFSQLAGGLGALRYGGRRL